MDRLLKRAQSNLEAKFRRDRTGSAVSSDSQHPPPSPGSVAVPKIRTPMRALPTDEIKVHSMPAKQRDGADVTRVPRRVRGGSPAERMPRLISPLKASPEKPTASPEVQSPHDSSSPRGTSSPHSPLSTVENQPLRDLLTGKTTHRPNAGADVKTSAGNGSKYLRQSRLPSVGNSPSQSTGARRMREEVHPAAMTTSAIGVEGNIIL